MLRTVGRQCTRSLSTTSATAKPFDSIPGPPIVPGYGTMAHFGQKIQTLGFPEAVASYYKEFGPVVKHQFAHGPEVFLFHPDASLDSFRQEGTYPTNAASEAWPMTLAMEKVGMESKISSVGPEWARLRKAMQKDIFSPAVAETYLPLLDEPTQLISQQFPKVTNMDEFTPLAAMDMFFSIMLGYNPKTVLGINGNKDKLTDEKDLEFAKLSVDTLSLGVKIMSNPTLSPQNPGPDLPILSKLFEDLFNRCHYYFNTIVKGQLEKVTAAADETHPLPYFFRLLGRGDIPEEEAKNELAGLLFAGVDTTHHVLLWAIFNLGRYPAKQEILRQEIIKVLGDGPLESKHLKSLPYLNQVLRESHRITPPSPIVTFRRLPQDSVVGGYLIPKETKISFALGPIQSDEQYVDQPNEFLPERWTAEELAKRKGTSKEILDHKLLRNPFGYGQRMCVGARVADMEIKAVLARMLRDWRFEWSPPKQEYQIVQGTMLRASPFPKMTWKPVK